MATKPTIEKCSVILKQTGHLITRAKLSKTDTQPIKPNWFNFLFFYYFLITKIMALNENEILTDKEKICLIHGFVVGIMTGHTDTRIDKPDYVDIEYNLIDKLNLVNANIDNNFITKLQEMDIYSVYRKIMPK